MSGGRATGIIAAICAAACSLLPAAPAGAAVGDLIVADHYRDHYPSGIVVRVDPATGERTLVSSPTAPAGEPYIDEPTDVALESDGDILVTEGCCRVPESDTGIIRVDPTSGARTLVSSNSSPAGDPEFWDIGAIAVEPDGDLLVFDGRFNRGGEPAVIRVDPETGSRTMVSSNSSPTGGPDLRYGGSIAIEDDGNILVAQFRELIRIDPVTGERSLVFSNTDDVGSFRPSDLTVAGDGGIIVTNPGAFHDGEVIRFDPETGSGTVVSSNDSPPGDPFFGALAAVAFEPGGDMVVTDGSDSGPEILRVDPVTGSRALVSSNFSPSGDPGFRSTQGLAVESLPLPPTLADTDPDSPANDNSLEVKGGAESGTTVRLYTTPDCSGAPIATGPAAQFASPGFTASVPDNSETTFRATATDEDGNTSACSRSSQTYIEDSNAPAIPLVADTDPDSPANDNIPEVKGSAEDGSRVELFTTADCSEGPVATGSAAQFGAPGLTAAVANDSTTAFRATATDEAGNTSPCSAPLTYVEDSTRPAAPGITDTDPDSPANDNGPAVKGSAEPGSTVMLYKTGCTGAPVTSGSAADFASPGFNVTVPNDSVTAFRAKASDAAGNVSPCSSPFSYEELSTPPTARFEFSANPVLTDDVVRFDASSSTGPGIRRFEWDLNGDGSFETDTGADPMASRSYSEPSEIGPGVRVTNGTGQSDVARSPLSIRPRPPDGLVGISIDDGARYTDDPEVTIDVVWPPLANRLLISNDGGFASHSERVVAGEIPWTLESSGPERLPTTAYVRFLGSPGVASTQTFTDDIILDEAPPRIVSVVATSGRGQSARSSDGAKVATAKGANRTYYVRTKARDKVSGVDEMQITNRKSKPGKLRTFKPRTTFRTKKDRFFVRVLDRAGNSSHWERVDTAGKSGR